MSRSNNKAEETKKRKRRDETNPEKTLVIALTNKQVMKWTPNNINNWEENWKSLQLIIQKKEKFISFSGFCLISENKKIKVLNGKDLSKLWNEEEVDKLFVCCFVLTFRRKRVSWYPLNAPMPEEDDYKNEDWDKRYSHLIAFLSKTFHLKGNIDLVCADKECKGEEITDGDELEDLWSNDAFAVLMNVYGNRKPITLLFLGETGEGKTTLLQSIEDFLLQTPFKDVTLTFSILQFNLEKILSF